MSFLHKVAKTIDDKLQFSTNQLGHAAQEKMMKNALSGDIFEVMGEAISKKMSSHFNNVYKYFTSDTHPEALMEQMGDEIDHKQTQAMQRLMQNLEKNKLVQLDYDYHRDVKKELELQEDRRQEQEQRKMQNQQPVIFIQIDPIPSSSIQKDHHTPQSIREEVIFNERIQIEPTWSPTPHKSSIQIHTETLNPQKSLMVKSQLINKRDIVKQLELRRQLNLERERKSKKMKNRLIKLEPLSRQKQQEKIEKQTKEKLDNALDFFNSIQLSKQSSNYKPTEWKQERTVTMSTPTKSIQESIVNKLRYSNKKRLQQLGFSPVRVERNSLFTTKNKQRSRSRDEPFVLPKPLPYNLYTINQSKNQMFRLKLI